MSLACCFTDDETPYCEGRRHKELAMCHFHTKQTIRRAILDEAMPADALEELVKFTDWFISNKLISNRWADAHQTIEIRSELDSQRDRRKSLEHEQSIVYYVRLTGDRIKIGTTTNMVRRMTSLRVRVADVLATEPGGYDVEAARHRQFGHLRHGRLEHFDVDAGLLAHIAAVLEVNGPPNITTDVA